MKITEAIEFFEDLISQTNKKSEIKFYQAFLTVLKNLENRDLTDEQLNQIESKLESLDLKARTINQKKYLKQKLSEFTDFLNKQYSWVPAGHYTSLGIVYGMIFGTGLGLTFGSISGDGKWIAIGMSMGTGMGMALGIAFGSMQDAEVKRQNRVLS